MNAENIFTRTTGMIRRIFAFRMRAESVEVAANTRSGDE